MSGRAGVRVGGVDVFGADAQADGAGGDAAEDGEILQEPEWEWEALDGDFGGEGRSDEAFVCEDLKSLGDAGGKFAALAHFVEHLVEGVYTMLAIGVGMRGENGCEDVGGGDGILNGEVDADSPDGRHGVRGIADAKKAGARPMAQAI